LLKVHGPVTLASRNPGKLAELRALAGGALELCSMRADLAAQETAEEGATYLENALAKAQAVARATGGPALADDSGLEVDALGGAPGLHSARYGGPGLDDAARSALLLRSLAGASDRRARFRCVLVLADGDLWLSSEGLLEGDIAEVPRGAGGFGYDPIFRPLELGGRTLAEASAEEKNAISHRARAMRSLLAMLDAMARVGNGDR
jgi:XTP/dITP diphosphohydrolase